jgi:hypothetical protein
VTVDGGFDGENYSEKARDFGLKVQDFWFSEESLTSIISSSLESNLASVIGFDPEINDDACYVNPVTMASCAAIGVVSTAIYGVVVIVSTSVEEVYDAISDLVEEMSEDDRPPCITVSGTVVPGGTIAYRPLDVLPNDTVQHGIKGSHHNIYEANQNPHRGQCFWKPVGAVKPDDLPAGAIPIEPFVR